MHDISFWGSHLNFSIIVGRNVKLRRCASRPHHIVRKVTTSAAFFQRLAQPLFVGMLTWTAVLLPIFLQVL